MEKECESTEFTEEPFTSFRIEAKFESIPPLTSSKSLKPAAASSTGHFSPLSIPTAGHFSPLSIPTAGHFPLPSGLHSRSLRPLASPLRGRTVPSRTDEQPIRNATARTGGPSNIASWLQYAAPDPCPQYRYPARRNASLHERIPSNPQHELASRRAANRSRPPERLQLQQHWEQLRLRLLQIARRLGEGMPEFQK